MKKTKFSVIAAIFLIAALGFSKDKSSHKKGAKTERQGNGIFVDEPKIYDDNALRMLEAAAATRLGQINPFDAASLISHLGAVQGATVSQSQFAVQANSIPIPGVTTTATNAAPNTVKTVDNGTSQKAGAAAPDTTTDNKVVANGATSQVQTQTTAPQVPPSVPALPSPPTFTVPSNFSVSSLNLLNEQMQLNAELIGFQLLSRGALSDANKFHLTLGFPINLSVPADYKYRNAVAEIEVTICNPPPGLMPNSEHPSLVDIIPRERTYNVAAIVSKSISLGGGVVAGVISFGGNFLRGRQTYYLVQDQDTVAFQSPPDNFPDKKCVIQRYKQNTKEIETISFPPSTAPVVFGWQFRPVLGKKVVQDGMKQTFVELAFQRNERACRPHLFVRTGWRRYDAKTGRVGEWIDSPEVHQIRSKRADFSPKPKSVVTGDNGDGTLTVRVTGLLATVARVRIGNVVLDDNSQGFERTPNSLKFTAPAMAIALQGAKLIEGNGSETDLVNPDFDPDWSCEPISPPIPADQPNPQGENSTAPKTSSLRHPAKFISAAWGLTQSEPQPSKSNTQQRPTPQDSGTNWKISSQTQFSAIPATGGTATVVPFSDTASLVTLSFSSRESTVEGEIPVVIIGSRLFGLRDAPFKELTQDKVSLIVPNDVIRANQQAIFQKLFVKGYGPKIYNLPSNFFISAVTLIASTDSSSRYAISGISLGEIKIYPPPDNGPEITANGTMAVFTLTKTTLQGLKNLIVQNGNATPIILALPTGTPDPPKASLDKATPIGIGDKSLVLKGSLLDTIVSIHFLEKPIPFALSADKKTITVQLPDGFSSTPGIQVIEVFYTDKTSVRYEVPVQKK